MEKESAVIISDKSDYVESLIRQLALEYGFTVKQIAPAKRGFFGETWKVQTDTAGYFVKIDYWAFHKESYKNSLSVIEYMTDNGLSFIPRVIKTGSGHLYCSFRQGVMAVFEYAQGENREDYPVERLFECLAQVYRLPYDGTGLEKEDFSTSVIDIFRKLRNEVEQLAGAELPVEAELSAEVAKVFIEKESVIAKHAEKLRVLSDACRANLEDFHITHGDAGGNCILDESHFSVIDWDSVKYAPIERDAWFFLCDSGQIEKINGVLARQGVSYRLKWERLCYYCYYSFFYYLTEYMQSILSAEKYEKKKMIAESLKDYLEHSWIHEQLDAAEHGRGMR